MEKKYAVILSCSDHYGHRLFATDAALRQLGYETTYITSDFDHNTKQTYVCPVPGCVQLHAMPYKKNLSIARLLSHGLFARDVFRYLRKQDRQPDVILAVVPPNTMAFFGARYKRRHPNVKLIFDIFDLWPETFPSGRAKKILVPAFACWAWIRDRYLPKADLRLTECDMFRRILKLDDAHTVCLCADPVEEATEETLREDRLDLAYLGAINNVIGIESIYELIRSLRKEKPVALHVIGKGERQDVLLKKAEEAGAQVIFYGPVFDEKEKQRILGQCHFGLNLMRDTVCIGLTMKSVEYFRFGLPVINSIPADTQALLEEYEAGIQWGSDCARQILDMDADRMLTLRENTRRLFREKFSRDVIHRAYVDLFEAEL